MCIFEIIRVEIICEKNFRAKKLSCIIAELPTVLFLYLLTVLAIVPTGAIITRVTIIAHC